MSSPSQSDQYSSATSIPDLPPEATGTGPDAETLDCVAKEMPDVPMAVPESMDINVAKVVAKVVTKDETVKVATKQVPAPSHPVSKPTGKSVKKVQTKTSTVKKTDKGIGKWC